MLIPSQFQVSESGAATYTIPIQGSPGVAGMEPKLSLNYSSQAGNGLLGMGWSLGGLGGVTRCPKTMAQDGFRGGVNFDRSDRYCLDGQRLMLISGVEGGDGTEYRTERESFAKIVSYGSAGNGPAWFKVWTKAGQVMEYGRTADARVEAQGKSTIRVWALNRIEDTNGNFLTVSYTKDSANGDYYPNRIDYTGNSKTNTAPVNSVQFQYEMRPDTVPLYQATSLLKNVVRMKSITRYSGSTLLRQMSLTYSTNPISSRSQLLSYADCAPSLNSCLAPISVEFSSSDTGFFSVQGGQIYSGNFGSLDQYSKQVVDLNGDGINDLLWMYSGPDGLWTATSLGKGDGTYGPVQIAQFSGSNFGPFAQYTKQVADVNGDGIADLWWMYSGDGGVWVCTATGKGDGTFNPVKTVQLSSSNYGTIDQYTKQAVDINGDGIADFVLMYSGSGGLYAYTALGRGDGTFAPLQGGAFSGSNFGANDQYVKQLADVDGDGIADLWWMYSGNGGVWIATATGKGDGTFNPVKIVQLSSSNYGSNDQYTKQAVDINGDGIADLVLMYSGSGGLYAYTALGRGDGTFDTLQGGAFSGSNFGTNDQYTKQLADINGDGIADLLWVYSGDGGLWVCTATGKGDGTFNPVQIVQLSSSNYGAINTYSRLVADINGDGFPDLVWMHSGADGLIVYTAKNRISETHVVKKFNSLASSTGVGYSYLTDKNIYTKDSYSSATYPLINIQAPLYVASSVVSSNGVGGATSTSYTYGGLKSDLTGRGLLGFRWMQTKQVETGLTSYTEYLQNWPYTGLPNVLKKTLVGGGNNGVLSQITNGYNCNDAANTTATPCSVGAGKRYFIYANQSIESGWDYNGAALPVITTKTEYDNWGNATKVDVSTSDGYGKITTNVYSNDSSNWYLGRLINATVISTAP